MAGNGVFKSAVLLTALGADVAARILSHMDEGYVEILVHEMTRLRTIPPEERNAVLEEFQQRIANTDALPSLGGVEYARQVLQQALGPEKAGEILETLEPSGPSTLPLATILESTSPESLAALMADEHPQLIALLASQLRVDQAAALLAALPEEVQGPVAGRLAEIEPPTPTAMQHLERCLMEKLRGDQSGPAADPRSGPRRVADILGQMRRSVENVVMGALQRSDPAIAEKVEQYRFSFDHLLQLEGRTLQRVLRDVEADTLRLAMKGMPQEQQDIIFQNMSERAAARLREDLEATGPTRVKDVEAAQQQMVVVARKLQETGEIQIQIGAGEDESEAFV
jgi:flagellar motor switch protein FliG